MNNKQQLDPEKEIYAVPEIRSFLHDLANPLTVVQLNLDILKSDIYKKNKAEIDRIVSTALKGVEHANKMILSVRSVSKAKSRTFEVNTEIQNIVAIFAEEYKQEGISVCLNLGSELRLQDNLLEFRRAIINLIVNSADALRATNHKNKLINISTYQKQQRFVIEIQDNGIGFDEKELKYLLLPGCTTKNNGDGLGLWIVMQAIHDKFRAKLECTSTPGVGSIFKISFPKQAIRQ